METHALTLDLLPGVCAVCRLDPSAELPSWALGAGPIVSVTRTSEELSVVCAADAVPTGIRAEGGWRVLKVRGPLAFSLTGILAALAAPLARAELSIFAVSTFDTDYLLVPQGQLEAALAALRAAGHTVRGD